MAMMENIAVADESVEARGFGLPARTHFRGANLGPTSLLVIVASLAAAAGFAISQALGWAEAWYPYPSLMWPAVDLRALTGCSLLFVPAILWRRRG